MPRVATRARPAPSRWLDQRRRWFLLSLGVLVLCIPSRGLAADQCISATARVSVSPCRGAKMKQTKKRDVSLSLSAKPSARLRNLRKPAVPKKVQQATARARRRAKLAPAVIRLLLTEIHNVKRLYENTPSKHPDRPRLMRRLAENFVELESSALREQERARSALKRARKAKAQNAAQKKLTWAKKAIRKARANAIYYYRSLVKQYPKWCRYPAKQDPDKRGCVDEALYFLAYEYEQIGQFKKARGAYLQLIQNWPQSKYVPEAYLAFGEMYFNEGQADPKRWVLAKQAYEKVLKYPAPKNKFWGYAHYKLGYVYWNQGKFVKALNEFKKVIDFGKKYPQLPGTKDLTQAARHDIVPVYALTGDSNQAFGFFRPLSGDVSPSKTKTFAMMEALGQNLLDIGKYGPAKKLYRDLLRRNAKSDQVCSYQANIAKATMALKSGQKKPIRKILKDQLAAYQRFAAEPHGATAKLRCANTTAALLSEAAMAWHLEAVGTGQVAGSGDQKTMAAADELYRLVLSSFTPKQFRQFTYPRIVKDDWPSRARLHYARADLLFAQKRWADCGEPFTQAFRAAPKGPDAAAALWAAAVCYRRALDASRAAQKPRTKPTRKSAQIQPLTALQKKMIRAFDRYLCRIQAPPADKVAQKQRVEIEFARAWAYYEAEHYEQAALGFRQIALHQQRAEQGSIAADLYLESLNAMRANWPSRRRSCRAEMAKDVPQFKKLYCTAKNRKQHAEHCDRLTRVARHLREKEAQQLVADADAGHKKADEMYLQAAKIYWSLWEGYGRKACEDKLADCLEQAPILYNCAKAYQAAGRLGKAISVRKVLVDSDGRLHKTEAAVKATYELGANYQAIAQYDAAALWYERLASAHPDSPRAPRALSDAVVLRLGLGHRQKALRNAKLFAKQYRNRQPGPAAQIAFAIGSNYAHRKDWRNAERQLSRALPQIKQHTSIATYAQALAALGRSYAALERPLQADTAYGKLRGLFKDPAAAKRQIAASTKVKAAQKRRLKQLLTAVGEGWFYLADKKRARAEAMKFPAYRGSGSAADVKRHIRIRVKPWIKRKRPAIEAATAAFKKVIKLNGGQPPPKWAVAAGAAVGKLWGEFTEDFRRAPYPKKWDQKGYIPNVTPPTRWIDLKWKYIGKIDKLSTPFKAFAKKRYVECLEYSVLYQHFDENSHQCERWLSKHYPKEFHIIEEFRVTPTGVTGVLGRRARPLDADGAIINP